MPVIGILKMMHSWSMTPQMAISIPEVRPLILRIRSAAASFKPLRSRVPVRIIRMMVISWLRLETKLVPMISSRSTTLMLPAIAVTTAETKMMAIGSSLMAKPTITTSTPSKHQYIKTPLHKRLKSYRRNLFLLT